MKTILLALLLCAFATFVNAQTTEFTYQGRLMDGALPANAVYDFEFRLFDAETGGTELGIQTRNGIGVITGIFTVRLDFGVQFPGVDRWLEISVKPAGGPAFTTLAPRQPVSSAPYSIKSRNADTAVTASNSTNLGGIAADQYVITNDTRMSDARNPLPGSGNYVQNSTTAQAASNFNISGNGTAGGTMTANAVTSATQYNIGADRVLAVSSFSRNAFVGINAGIANGFGDNNSFFGSGAGQANVSGRNNSFFGRDAGQSNTSNDNSFFGAEAGFGNSSGARNSAFGQQAGRNNTTGTDTAFFGFRTGLNNTADENSFFGSRAGDSNTTGTRNSLFGYNAGSSILTGLGNSLFGHNAGASVTGNANSFFGASAGAVNTATGNSFFGFESGLVNTTGRNNAFFGSSSGSSNTTGIENSFIGFSAGRDNVQGSSNTFVGNTAGVANNSGSFNTFFGESAGRANFSGLGNTFLGHNAGITNVSGDNNTIIGNNANLSSSNLTFATAIGADAVVSASNTIQIGRASGTDSVIIPGRINDLTGTQFGQVRVKLSLGGATPLCGIQNGVYFAIATCLNPVSNIVESQQKQIEALQRQIAELKAAVCAVNSKAAICKEVK